MKAIVVIPSLNPDEKLAPYVAELIEGGFDKILLIDDGSDKAHRTIFEELLKYPEVELFTHVVNMGKGRALKDAFNYCIDKYSGEYDGVITADSDGQHTVVDVKRMKEALDSNPNALILGCRDFDQSNVPPKSVFGNKMTCAVMKLFYGGSISDTQTGLRAGTFDVIKNYLTLDGERFEYETGMLIEALRAKTPIVEVKIQTVYYEENKGTHFRPIVDSWRIYKLIFASFIKYAFVSIASSVIDLGMFQILILALAGLALKWQVWAATIGARIISSLFNYFMNREVVFKGKHAGNTMIKYYILVVIQMCLSALFVYLLATKVGIPKLVVKLIVDTVLFIGSFIVQKRIVFREAGK